MTKEIWHIVRPGSSLVEIKKSKFIGRAEAVSSKEEAASVLAEEKKKYYDAKHHCYAWIIGNSRPEMKFSDDGEPGQTAGKPILNVLETGGVSDAVIVVTRYFGGTLLGTGGLTRAYTEAAALALSRAEKRKVVLSDILTVTLPYGNLNSVVFLLKQMNLSTEDMVYGADVQFTLIVPENLRQEAEKRIMERTAGRAAICFQREVLA